MDNTPQGNTFEDFLPEFAPYYPETYAEADGYIEDLEQIALEADQATSTNPYSDQSAPTTLGYRDEIEAENIDDVNYRTLSEVLNETELLLLQLKSKESLSTRTLNKIISIVPKLSLNNLPQKFEQVITAVSSCNDMLESARLPSTSSLKEFVTPEGVSREVFFIPLHRWLHIFVQLNLLSMLVKSASTSTTYYGDISTGTWFAEFVRRVPAGFISLAIDVYYDHWKVSKGGKIGGLYITIANLLPDVLMCPDNKFVCCLVPQGIGVHRVLQRVLAGWIYKLRRFEIHVGGTVTRLYVEIA